MSSKHQKGPDLKRFMVSAHHMLCFLLSDVCEWLFVVHPHELIVSMGLIFLFILQYDHFATLLDVISFTICMY